LHPALFRHSAEAVDEVETEVDAVWTAAGCPVIDSAWAAQDNAVRPGPRPAPRLATAAGAQAAEWMEPGRLAGTLLTQLEGIDMPVYIKALERALIDRAIDRCNGSVSAAARVLRTNRTTIIAKIKRSA